VFVLARGADVHLRLDRTGLLGRAVSDPVCLHVGDDERRHVGEGLLEANGWAYGVAVIVGAFVTWTCGRRWNGTRGLKPWDLEAMIRRRRFHTVFSLPMELWAIPTVLIGVWVIVANLPSHA
jgi:uncharacterized iron-regulated membrane protein